MSDDSTAPKDEEPQQDNVADQQATPEPDKAPSQEANAKRKAAMKLKMVALGGALFGMVFGAVVEMFVQGAMESTGWFGPTLDSVIADQESNFTDIKEKLAALQTTEDPEERAKLEKDLQALIAQQEELVSVTHEEIAALTREVEEAKASSLQEGRTAGGAEVWLRKGQSFNVGSRSNVFSLIMIDPYRRARVNINGRTDLLTVGQFVEANVGDDVWKVFYRQTSRGDDKLQVGFDIVPPEKN